MTDRQRQRLVFSTERGKTCPRCGWPTQECRCASSFAEPVPAKPVATLRISRSGRAGKTVTVVDGLPRNPAFLKELVAELKQACGTGGTAAERHVELQGDQRAALRALLARKGWTVKG